MVLSRERLSAQHVVHFYEDEKRLLDRLEPFSADALLAGQALVVVARPSIRDGIAARLATRDIDVDRLRAEGQFLSLDARETLDSLLESGMPSRKRFSANVGNLVGRLLDRFDGLSAYGEMVDVLAADGRYQAASQLEQLWNELGDTYPFVLWCGYKMGHFEGLTTSRAFLDACEAHQVVYPAIDEAALEDPEHRRRVVASLQQQAVSLRSEIEERKASERRLRENQTLAAALAEAVTPANVVHVLTHEMRELLDATSAAIHTVDDEAPDDAVAAVLRTRQPVWAPSRVVLPLRFEQRTLATMTFTFAEPRILGQDDREFLLTLADQFGQALERARLYEMERRGRERLALLAGASEVLASSLDYELTLRNVVQLALPALGDFGFFDVVEEGGVVRRITRAYRDPRRQAILDQTHWSKPACENINLCALATGRAALHPNIDERWLEQAGGSPAHEALWRDLAFHSMITVPLSTRGQTMGALTLFFADDNRRHDQSDLELAEELARRAASAVENARLFIELREAVTRQKEADRRKDEFLAMLGHELRNPLAPIMTALELMKLRGDFRAERERAVIERQARHLVRLVDDLLDVSRITRGKVQLRRAPVEISEVIAKAIEMASPLLEQRRQDLVVSVPREGLCVEVDLDRMSQVVSNLLTNAAKYTPTGGHIRVLAAAEGGQVVVRVRDDGIGIAKEMVGRMFDLFVQGERSIDRAEGGLGIGLTLVRSLTELHGGSVQAFSDGPGHGSEFVVRLPARPAIGDAQVSIDRTPVPTLPAKQSRILVVDDNEDAAITVAEVLRELGYDVAVAHDGPQALGMVDRFAPDVVVLDIGLPVMDGFEVARRMRAHFSNGATPKLIALTGYGQEVDKAHSRAAGFDHHLVKPVDLAALQAAIGP